GTAAPAAPRAPGPAAGAADRAEHGRRAGARARGGRLPGGGASHPRRGPRLPAARRAGRGADAAGQAHGRPALARPAARQHRGLGGDPRAGARPRAGGMSASIPRLAAGAARGAGRTAGSPTDRAAAVGALQAALAAEHAAVYGYGVAGAHLSGARQRAAAHDWQIHQASRDALAAMITALGAQPVAAAAAYRLPFRVSTGRAAVMLAAFLEDRGAAAYLGVGAPSGARPRRVAAAAPA